jgi:hypothetical protein
VLPDYVLAETRYPLLDVDLFLIIRYKLCRLDAMYIEDFKAKSTRMVSRNHLNCVEFDFSQNRTRFLISYPPTNTSSTTKALGSDATSRGNEILYAIFVPTDKNTNS